MMNLTRDDWNEFLCVLVLCALAFAIRWWL